MKRATAGAKGQDAGMCQGQAGHAAASAASAVSAPHLGLSPRSAAPAIVQALLALHQLLDKHFAYLHKFLIITLKHVLFLNI